MKKYIISILLFLPFISNAKIKLGEKQKREINAFIISGSVMFGSAMNSCMDEMNDHYHSSIFGNFNPKFFNHEGGYSSQYATRIGGYPVDAWHLSKSMMVMALSIPPAIVLHENFPILKTHPVLDRALWWCITGTAWNLVFNTNYNHILR